jgi:hypothetical protein
MAAVLAAVLAMSVFVVGTPSEAVGRGPSAAVPVTTTAPVHRARQCASVRRASATTIVVPVVVDMGGPSDTGEVACVPVPAGSNGAQVLAARATMLGEPAPRYAESGLLCAIDGYPATGCGQQVGSHYAYWAYYHGGTSWTYASVGPAEWQVFAGDVEGWRFQPDGTATPADPPPRAPSEAATLCPSSVPPTTTTTTASVPPTTSPTTTVAGGPSPTGGGSPAPPTGTAPGPATSRGGATGSNDGRVPATTGPTTAPTTSTPAVGAHGGTVPVTEPAVRASPHLVAAKHDGGGHGDGLVGVVVALAVIALLAAGALVRTRRLSAGR